MQSSEQEEFWKGDFGTGYTDRNECDDRNSMAFWKDIVGYGYDFDSVYEFGANRGANIKCLRKLFPDADFGALEINAHAADKLRKIPGLQVDECTLFEYPGGQWDFVVSKGLLIHIAPDLLDMTYDILYNASKRYIFLAEYYNPTPVSIPYRGHDDRLFKRDFAGEMMDRYPLALVDYGFWYHRDEYPQDDITWFLLEKIC